MSINSSQKRTIIIGEVLVLTFIVSLWIPSSAAYPLWGNILGTFVFTLIGAAWCIINVRYPHLLAWMRDEETFNRVAEWAMALLFPFLLAGMDVLFWNILQRSIPHTRLFVVMAALNLGLLIWWGVGLLFSSLSEKIAVQILFAFLGAVLICAGWLLFPFWIDLVCMGAVIAAYAFFLAYYRRWEIRQAALFDYERSIMVEGLDEQTISFLRAILGVTVTLRSQDTYEVTLAVPEAEWNVVIEPGGRKTWLFSYPGGQVLGLDCGCALPARLWAATAEMWEAHTSFAFAQARYLHERSLGIIAPSTPPPDPADYPIEGKRQG